MPNNLTPEIREAIRKELNSIMSDDLRSEMMLDKITDRIASLFPAPADKELWEIAPLEWKQYRHCWIADTPLGRYAIMDSVSHNGWVVAYPNDVYLPPAYETIELAQSAAAQHYREKMKQGLKPAV